MKKSLSGLDVHYLVQELQFLVGAKISKIFQDEASFDFQLHLSGQGKKYLNIQLPNYAVVSDTKTVAREEPPGFCMYLRKHLTNARIAALYQHQTERIIVLDLEKEEKSKLIIELFGKGNLLLCTEDLIIKSLYDKVKLKSRILAPKEKYLFPENAIDIQNLDAAHLKTLLSKSTKSSLVTFLAVELSLGGVTAEELCARVGTDKNTSPPLFNLIPKLLEELQKLFQEKLNPQIIHKEGVIEEIIPIAFKSFQGESVPSFSQALADHFLKTTLQKSEEKSTKAFDAKKEKIMTILESQKKSIEELQKGSIEATAKADSLYTHYLDVKQVLDELNNRKKKQSWEEIKKTFKHPLLKEIREKEGLIFLEL